MSDTFECPICGATVKNNALACPECGADERTGLYRSDAASESIYDGLDLPEDDTFDYDEFAAREFGRPKPKSPRDIIVGIVAVLLILAFASIFIFAI
ncbi:hypothetical protein [Cerasicoccus maritimus]|uniref:hypothetical protein n=1 Tax=Cerasicoccus maritimus TaxID=490089 RepID=UPI0028525577|nr:hypothetical protein [Cerasicoccus maritimus]